LAYASANDKNQCAFKQFWRSCPLKLFTPAFSVALPGRVEVDFDAALVGPLVHRFGGELSPVVGLDRPGQAELTTDLVEHPHDIFPL
jgi:hypothetical protein